MIEMVQAKLNGRWDIIIPKHRADRPEWKLENGGWEKLRLDSMYKHTKRGMTCLYIGSELGDMPGLLASWGAKLVLIEPNPSSWPSVKMIWEANKFKTPLNYCGFASDVTEETPSNPDIDHNGENWWVIDERGWPKCAYDELKLAHGFSQLNEQADGAPQIRVDDLVKQHNLKVDIISCDTEGSEGCIFRGAEDTLREQKPIIYLSGHEDFMRIQYNESLDDLREWIKKLGYKETFLENHHEHHLVYEPA